MRTKGEWVEEPRQENELEEEEKVSASELVWLEWELYDMIGGMAEWLASSPGN